jgi:hypothetical protein
MIGLAFVSALMFAANILRLVLICWSKTSGAYWHDGTGAQIFALAVNGLIAGCAYFIARRPWRAAA